MTVDFMFLSQVGHLVVANADYIIDSLCRQLRHLDLNPHVPNVLAAMLSYIGVAHQILPLLEEPVRYYFHLIDFFPSCIELSVISFVISKYITILETLWHGIEMI